MSDSTLQQGDDGAEVLELQRRLQQLGFDPGTPDGDYGPATAAAVSAYREWRGLQEGTAADPDLRSSLAADAEYYGAADGAQSGDDPYADEGSDGSGGGANDDPDAGVRQAAIDAATAEIGQVRSKESGGTDETGKDVRYGWERLQTYFGEAAPGVWSEDTVKYLDQDLPSWCGIFTLWALKAGGASVGNWGMGTGIPGMRPVAHPQPGDIGYMTDNQHHCLIVRVEGDTVHSVDGNTVGDDTGGGEVNDRTRPRSAFAGFFTVFG